MSDKKFIIAGEIYVAKEPTVIATVLGSCVAICLYDKILKVSAMNHYLLPLWNGNGIQSPRFGNLAIPKMIELMQKNGSMVSNLEAKVFGGAQGIDTKLESMMIGKKNIVIAKEILSDYGINIVAEDTGGRHGRKIMMESVSGKIKMKYTSKD